MAFPSDVWNAAGKTVALFPSEKGNAPLVLLHTVQGEGEDVYRKARGMTDADFSFAAVGGLRWDDEMSPWESPPLFKGDTGRDIVYDWHREMAAVLDEHTFTMPLVAGAASMDMIYFSNVQLLIMGEVTPEECAANMQNECTAAMQG